jgi:hypothetical protein
MNAYFFTELYNIFHSLLKLKSNYEIVSFLVEFYIRYLQTLNYFSSPCYRIGFKNICRTSKHPFFLTCQVVSNLQGTRSISLTIAAQILLKNTHKTNITKSHKIQYNLKLVAYFFHTNVFVVGGFAPSNLNIFNSLHTLIKMSITEKLHINIFRLVLIMF